MIASSLLTPPQSLSSLHNFDSKTLNPYNKATSLIFNFKKIPIITMRDRGKNRKPLQRGRNLSVEAIQTVQALKRAASKKKEEMVQQVFESKVNRLLKLDLLAVLRELLRQNEPLLALQVFKNVRKEHWYKPQLLLYSDMIKMLASNNLFEKVELLLFYLKIEKYHLDADTEDFNTLLATLMDSGFTTHAMECFQLMKEVECDRNESTFRILINGLESKGDTDLSCTLRQEAEKYIGWPLEPVEEEQMICN